MTAVQAVYEAVVDGDFRTVSKATEQALQAGVPAEVILNEGLILAMKEVGHRYEKGQYFLPEMLISAKAMQASLNLLRPLLGERTDKSSIRVVLGTVQGDLHSIGKNLVGMMLEGAGFEVVDLGVDVSPEKFAQAAPGAQVIGLSALLTTTMPTMGRVISALKDAGVREQVKIIVGGAPVTREFAAEIGADAYSTDAASAVRQVKALLNLE